MCEGFGTVPMPNPSQVLRFRRWPDPAAACSATGCRLPGRRQLLLPPPASGRDRCPSESVRSIAPSAGPESPPSARAGG